MPILKIIERWESSQLEDSEKDEIYGIIKSHTSQTIQQLLEEIIKTLEEKEHYNGEENFDDGYSESIQDTITLLQKTLTKIK